MGFAASGADLLLTRNAVYGKAVIELVRDKGVGCALVDPLLKFTTAAHKSVNRDDLRSVAFTEVVGSRARAGATLSLNEGWVIIPAHNSSRVYGASEGEFGTGAVTSIRGLLGLARLDLLVGQVAGRSPAGSIGPAELLLHSFNTRTPATGTDPWQHGPQPTRRHYFETSRIGTRAGPRTTKRISYVL